MEKLHIREVLVVEGKHDAIKLAPLTDATVFVTDGFRIFRDKERLSLLRQMAEKRGVILLTDSDGAGFVIRNYLIGALPGIAIRHAFIPEVTGKEKRKSRPGKEGLLGVEGMDAETLRRILADAAAAESPETWLTRARLYEDGLIGRPDSARKRAAILRAAGLPQKLSTARMLEWINAVWTETDYTEALEKAVCGI
ncbi:MAG: DUF4093 domain-containing protein [Clostridia bacterium]|nr:DUF4093 domain-containing protein [Clostridia bacterium]